MASAGAAEAGTANKAYVVEEPGSSGTKQEFSNLSYQGEGNPNNNMGSKEGTKKPFIETFTCKVIFAVFIGASIGGIIAMGVCLSGHCTPADVADPPDPKLWDGLQVTFGVPIPIVMPNPFADVPRTVSEARNDGWEKLSSGCDGNLFYGERWIAFSSNLGADDHAVMPIYDVNGYIAGLQVAIPRDMPQAPGYPTSDIQPPFVLDSSLDMWILTAYFTDPSAICTTGRSQEDFTREGTGDRLILQNGPELMRIPDTEKEANTSLWSFGQCFAGMGQHFWYNVRSDMSCDEFYPVFTLYDKQGRLDSFGWAFLGDLPSPRYEHPPAWALGAFLPDNYPSCLDDKEYFTTLHIYMISNGSDKEC